MISLRNIHLTLGGREILRDVTFNLDDGECAALVGPNGCGKSSLLRVLAGVETADGGEVSKPNSWTIGYLPQEADLDVEHSLEEELLDAFREVREAMDRMVDLEHAMAETPPDSREHERVMKEYARASHLVENHDGYGLEAQVRRVGAGLGFQQDDYERSCREFSGGWRMRILLAKILLRKPDLLLLDEPTNHLDLESLLWFEEWIRTCGRTVLLVSHERATMDRLVKKVVHIERGRSKTYRGNYSQYLVQSEQEREQQWAAYKRQQKEIESLERFINRFRANAARASLVQSKIRQLEKIELIEPPFHPTAIHFHFPKAPPSYSEVITLRNLGHAYEGDPVFSNIDLTIRRGEKIALVGRNGSGKSTLLRIMAERMKPTEGECVLGRKVSMAYFAQYDTDGLSSETPLVQDIEASAPRSEAHRARDLLGAFLFSGDDVEKPLRALSGGERTRYRMAKMLFSPVNLLLLDEPTNHLDITSRSTVERALRSYTGTLVLVSHDRIFMDSITDRIIEIEDGAVRDFPGNYTDYVAVKENMLRDEMNGNDSRTSTPSNGSEGDSGAGATKEDGQPTAKEERIRLHEERRARNRRIQSLEKKASKLESEVEKIEREMEELDAEMARPEVAASYEKLNPLSDRRRELEELHRRTLEQWEETMEAVESLRQETTAQST